MDKTQAVGLFDNLRTVFLFVRCDPRDMNCNPTFVQNGRPCAPFQGHFRA